MTARPGRRSATAPSAVAGAAVRCATAAGLAVLVLAAAARPAGADDGCRPVLDASVRVASGATRGCSIWVAGHDAIVEQGAEVEGDVFALSGRAIIDGTVRGSVNVIGGDAAIAGRVIGDVYASGDVRIAAAGRVDGRVTGGRVRADAAARLGSDPVELGRGWTAGPAGARWSVRGAGRALWNVAVTVVLAALFGALAALSLPRWVNRLRDTAARGTAWTLLATLIGLAVVAAALAVAWLPGADGVSWLAWLGPIVLAAFGALGLGARLGRRLAPRRPAPVQVALGLGLPSLGIAALNQTGLLVLLCGGSALLLVWGAWAIGVALLSLPFRSRAAAPRAQIAAATAPFAAPDGTGGADEHVGREPTADAAPTATPPLTPAATPAADAGPEPPATAHAAHTTHAADGADADDPLDLRRIPGITPVYAHLLRAGGIETLAALADRDPDEVVACLAAPDVIGIDRETAALWVAMARRRLGR